VTRTVEIQIQVPDTTSDGSLRLAEGKAKEAFILVLQQQGELTIREAASALGLTYEGYLELLAEHGLPATSDDTEPAALDTLRYVRQKLARGLKDLEEDRVVSQEEMERRMDRWLDK
jgi:hypothetical protein